MNDMTLEMLRGHLFGGKFDVKDSASLPAGRLEMGLACYARHHVPH
jgi:hypothetical protein